MISKKLRNIIIVSLSMGGLLAVVGNGCSKGLVSNLGSITGSNSNTGDIGATSENPEIVVIPGAKTASLVYSKQVLDHLTSCAGVIQPSERSISVYEQKKGSISTYGTVNTVTAPMMMAISSIASEVCQDVIEQEAKVGARVFVGFDMSSSNVVSTSILSDAMRRLALSCWQRPEDADEANTLLSLIQMSIPANEPMAQKKSALMLCTSMLSSLESLLN